MTSFGTLYTQSYESHPSLVTTVPEKELRHGKVRTDWARTVLQKKSRFLGRLGNVPETEIHRKT